jgi:methylmalonyl-CoA mutase N-terminal domain/subunit
VTDERAAGAASGGERGGALDRERWERETVQPFLARAPERKPAFETMAGLPVERVYTGADLPGWREAERLGLPGEYPFTRGIYPTMYRGRLWTMRMFAGFGRPEDTNRRFKFLLEQGQTGLSTAFDMPSLMGYDADHPRARGEVGREGVSVSTLDDMERLFDGIPLGRVTTSMTINCTASIVLAMYLAVAERQGVPWTDVDGTIQNDMLKEFSAQKEWICPPEPAVRIVVDMIEFCMDAVPKFHPVSISGYHIREAGATAVQELAFTLADGIAYVEACVRRGLDVDRFAPQLSFFFDIHSDFFEEIAKLRAARRIWAGIMKQRFGARNPRAMLLRTHTQTAGVSLTAQQPLNNVARVALQALAAVLGGAQSLHTNSYDETWALPTEEAVTVALRTQQIVAEETGVTHTVDPLGGSYFVEALTERMETEARRLIARVDELGGMVRALDAGFPQQEIADSGYRTQLLEDAQERVVVGVNRYVQPEEKPIAYLRLDEGLEREQVERVRAAKAARSAAEVSHHVRRVADACRSGQNLMPVLVDAVKARVSLGEISDVYREAFGRYREPIIF